MSSQLADALTDVDSKLLIMASEALLPPQLVGKLCGTDGKFIVTVAFSPVALVKESKSKLYVPLATSKSLST